MSYAAQVLLALGLVLAMFVGSVVLAVTGEAAEADLRAHAQNCPLHPESEGDKR